MKTVLIIIAACNEAASLRTFLPRLFVVINKFSIKGKVLLVSDGSDDTTVQVALDNGCDVIENPQNLGIGHSLRLGYKKALDENYDFTVTVDADGQHDETLIPVALDLLLNDTSDIVVASRYHPESERLGVPFDRDLLNISVTAQMKIITGWDITDPLSGFWAMKRDWFEFAYKNGKQERYGIHLETLIKTWFLPDVRPRRVEIPHPAIYKNHGTRELLTREYSSANKEIRVDRFGTHAMHILEILDDVINTKGDAVRTEINERRRNNH